MPAPIALFMGIGATAGLIGRRSLQRGSKGASSDPNSVFSIESEWIKSPEDVVPLALFLASHPHPGLTGQSFSLMGRTW